MNCELGIIGAGPAGYSAGIYAGRAGIDAIIFDKMAGGGLAMVSPNIENYAGFETITGADLMDKMGKHAGKYAKIRQFEEVINISKNKDLFDIETQEKKHTSKAILLCLGTEHRKLNVPGEEDLAGKGVSYCATCDGYFFKDKKVAVIGGGNSAVIEAIYLKQIGCKEVFVIHRRDRLRAEDTYIKNAEEVGVKIIYETHVESINGTQNVEYLIMHNTNTNEKSNLAVDGVFVSIGEEPQNMLAKKLNVKLDENGYIIVDKQQRTNIKGVYAAGDITGGLRQIITACAEGAIAALASTEVLGKQYPY